MLKTRALIGRQLPPPRWLGRPLFSSADKDSSTESTTDIIQACYELRSGIQGLNDRFKGPLDQKNAKNTMLPFVFLLGNHSSGKSSFINYVLKRKVQVAGVAPTDDNFTIIAPGRSDQDRDGPALIGKDRLLLRRAKTLLTMCCRRSGNGI